MQRVIRVAVAAAGILGVAACSAGATTGPAITTVNPVSPSYGSVQFAVGTANLYGNGQIGLNVVSTFRQTNGASATGVNTPSITGPFTFTATPVSGGGADPYSSELNGGPSWTETQAGSGITGTPQTVQPGTPNCDGNGTLPSGFISCQGGIPPNTTTFGQSGGVFAMGLGPFNVVSATQQSYSYQPYPQPFYDSSHFALIPWGGPPAFDPGSTGMGERSGVGSINGFDSFGDPFFLGVGEGITTFGGVTPSTGTYKLSVAIAIVQSGGTVYSSTLSASATLHSLALLPTLTTPVVTPDANGDGGATFTTSLPPGVSEAYVQIVDYGPGGGPNNGAATAPTNCQGSRGTLFAPVYYTIHIMNAATATYTLPANIGPNLSNSGGKSNLQPSPSLCTGAQNSAATGATTPGDDIIVQMVGFDYPIYQAALGLTQQTTPENPTITGASGQADITISVPMEQDAGGTSASPAAARRMPRRAAHRIHR